MECIYCLTQLSDGYIYIYIYNLLHREQLHDSALENGHLQVVYETLSKQLYKTYIYWLLKCGREGVKWAQDLVSVLKVEKLH